MELEQTGNLPQSDSTTESTANAETPQKPFWDKMDESQATETPEPIADESTEAPEAEAEPEPTEEVDADDNYLPTEQEKVFPIETLAKYAKRFGYTLEEIQADPRLQNTLKDKLNSDIWIEQQKAAQQEQQQETAEEPTLDVPATAETALDRSQWIEQLIAQSVDQKAADEWGRNFLVAAGVDPNDTEALKVSGAVGKEMLKGAADLTTTLMQQLLPQYIESNMPGITEMYQRSLYAQQWDRVATSMKDAKLPAYGTPEFQTAIKAAADAIPGFANMVFTGKDGRPLPEHQQIAQKYGLLAKSMAGQKVTPQAVQQAISTGKKQAKDAERSRAAAKVLGAGQGNKQFVSNDNATDSVISAYQQRKGGNFWK